MKKTRGYLLMELMLASAIISVALLVAMDHIGSARKAVTYSSHRQTAISLAKAKCDEIMSSLPSVTADQATLVAAGASFPGFKWAWVTTTPTLASDPQITATPREVTCTVQFPTEYRSIEDQNVASGVGLDPTLAKGDARGETQIKQLWFSSPLR